MRQYFLYVRSQLHFSTGKSSTFYNKRIFGGGGGGGGFWFIVGVKMLQILERLPFECLSQELGSCNCNMLLLVLK